MSVPLEIRPLSERDLCTDFDAGGTPGGLALTDFLRRHAKKHQRQGVSATFLALTDGKIAGYVTLVGATVFRKDVEGVLKSLPPYPLPVLLIARMATAADFQGKRLVGPRLMRDVVFVEAVARRAGSGCVGIATDAKPEAVTFYARWGFTTLRASAELPALSRMFLPLATVQRAMEEAATGITSRAEPVRPEVVVPALLDSSVPAISGPPPEAVDLPFDQDADVETKG